MIRLLLVVLLLASAMWLGPWLTQNPGYLMLVLGPWTIEMTLVGFAIILLLSLTLLWLTLRILRPFWGFRNWTLNPFRGRQQRKARLAFEQAALALAAGRFQDAEQYFDRSDAMPEFTMLRQSMACYAALQAGHATKAMQLAEQLDATKAQSCYVKADLLLRQNQAKAALELLQPHMLIPADAPLLAPLYFQALLAAGHNIEVFHTVLKAIEQKWFTKAQWQVQRYQMYPQAIRNLAAQGVFDESSDYWLALPSKERKSMAAVLGRVWAKVKAGQAEQAEKLLVDHLSYSDLPLVWPVLRHIPLKRHVVLLRKQLQHWLRDHQEDAVLYATLAYCAEQDGEPMQAEMAWQKALQYQPGLKTS